MTAVPLKIFTDPALIPRGVHHCVMLDPFLGNPGPQANYAELTAEGAEFLALAGPDEADVALLPFDAALLTSPGHPAHAEAVDLAGRFLDRAGREGLRTLILANGDSTAKVGDARSIVYRVSLDGARKSPNEFAMPGWYGDHMLPFGEPVTVRDKGPVPTVGFCGMAASRGPGPRRRLENLARALGRPFGIDVPHRDGLFLREKAMGALARSAKVRTNFLRRANYFAGVTPDTADADAARREYAANSVASDYVLCVRGFGNFSYRFYETLSIGRLPLLVDTRCVLPWEDAIDYREFCVIVPETRLSRAGDDVAAFHDALSPERFRALQSKARHVWETHLSPPGFFRQVAARHAGARDVPGVPRGINSISCSPH